MAHDKCWVVLSPRYTRAVCVVSFALTLPAALKRNTSIFLYVPMKFVSDSILHVLQAVASLFYTLRFIQSTGGLPGASVGTWLGKHRPLCRKKIYRWTQPPHSTCLASRAVSPVIRVQ